MSKHTSKLIESTLFMVAMTALGGFCNAYTFMTRGGVFANAHTANITRMTIAAATMSWEIAFQSLVPVIGCILGALFCEFVRDNSVVRSGWLGGNWHRKALLLEFIALFIVGFIPTTVPHAIVNAFMSFVTGFQLDIFRIWWGGGHNTTIMTGNLRNLAQHIHDALRKKTPDSGEKMRLYVILVLSFALGAFVCTRLCLAIGIQASWLGCVLLLVLLVWMHQNEKKVT